MRTVRRTAIFYSLLCALAIVGPASAQTSALPADLPRLQGPLTVEQAVRTGLRSNLGVQAMQADARAARAETRATRAMTLPQVSANSYAAVGNETNIFNTSPNVTPVNSLVVPAKPFGDQNITLMVPIYTGGRLGSLVRAASESERAASAAVSGEQADASLAIKDAYYKALLAGEMIKVAQARVEAAQALVDTSQAQFEAGKGIEASVSRARTELTDALRMRTTAQNDREKMLLDLKAAMGVQLDSDVALSDTLTFTPPQGDLNSLLADAAHTRPELQAAQARQQAAGARVRAAKGSFSPQVYGTAMADAFTVQDSRSGGGYTVGVTLSFPLFDAGQRRAEVGQAQAMRERSLLEARSLEQSVAREVRQAWLDVQTAEQNYKNAEAGVQSAQQAYDVMVMRVQNQKSILVEQLDALAALTQARGNEAQALYDHAIALARLQRAIGKP